MRVPKLSPRRMAVATVAVATVAAGLPALLTSAATAATTGDINLLGPTHGAAGSCLTYTVTPTDAFGRVANDTGTVVVRLTENPANDAGQDVDFCNPGTQSTPTVRPHYVNANNATQSYAAGPTITSTATTGAGSTTPDVASPSTPALQANPTGKDTAVFVYNGANNASTTITFGVVGLVPGGATIDAFRSADGDEVQNATGDYSRSLNVTFSAGGLPGSTQAADAVTKVAITPQSSYSPTGGAAHSFSVLLTNSAGDGVSGVTPAIAAFSGPNAATTTAASTYTATCTATNNAGTATCSYKGTKSGTDTVTVWVDQTRARTPNPTGGLDSGEPRDTATATTTVSTAQARVIDLVPATANVTSGTTKVLTATVTDAAGTPASGVAVTFTESGPGSIQGGTVGNGGTSTLNATTDAAGQATVTLVTATTDVGTSTVTAAIRTPANTVCQTNGGRCTDSSTLTVASASPSPSPSPTTLPCSTASTLLGAPFIYAMETGNVTVTATRGSTVDLFAYTRPTTTYAVVRTGVVTGNGTISWGIRPPRNTRLYAQQRGCAAGNQVVQGVRTTLSLNAVRNGTRSYTFFGDSLPARPGGLIVTLYRINADGSQVIAAQVRANAANGEWSLTRQFTGSGRFTFQVRAGQDLQNAPGASRTRPTIVY